MLLRKDFTNLHFGRTVVTDSPSHTIAIAQIEHSTGSGSPDGHAQKEKLYWLPILALFVFFFFVFCLKKRQTRVFIK
jgi:hypothetical protein